MIQISSHIFQKYATIKPTYKRIYYILKEAILSGELPLEKKIPEELLAETFGISRTPLRKALEELKNEGIWNSELWDTPRFKRPSKKEMNDLLEYDALLESNAAKIVAHRGISAEELHILKDLNNALRNINKDFDREGIFIEQNLIGHRDTHLQFHLMIARLTDNKNLYEAITTTRMKMRQYSSLNPFPNESPSYTYKHIIAVTHDSLIEAIENRLPEAAYAWMLTDILRAKSRYLNSYITPKDSLSDPY